MTFTTHPAYNRRDRVPAEALRLSTQSLTVRRAAAPWVLPPPRAATTASSGGTRAATTAALVVRAGDRVALFPPVVHFDATIFDAPHEFRWDRFVVGDGGGPAAAGAAAAVPPRLTSKLMPFGGGVSMCPGRTFARREIKSFIATVLTSYEVASDCVAVGRARGGRWAASPRVDHECA